MLNKPSIVLHIYTSHHGVPACVVFRDHTLLIKAKYLFHIHNFLQIFSIAIVQVLIHFFVCARANEFLRNARHEQILFLAENILINYDNLGEDREQEILLTYLLRFQLDPVLAL